jgi:cation:H+ antiporter
VDLQLALWQWIVVFAASAAVIMLAGTFLARAGDSIATRTRLGGLFVGMLLMASATSLPEIVTDVSAALAGAPDLAVADLFGSSMANMAILGLLDLASRRSVWPGIELGHARVGAIAIALTALIVLGVISPTGIRIGWLGIEPIVVVVAYVGAAAWIGRSEPALPPTGGEEAPADGVEELLTPIGWAAGEGSLRRDLVTFGLAAVAILVSGPSLAISAQGIAEETGIAQTFIGITLLAVATSLPELVASLAAIRIGAHDLAVGNLFGSNAFNMTIVLWVDLAYTDGPVLDAISIGQMVPGIGAILMMALAIGAIVSGTGTRLRRGEPDAVLLILAYFGLLALSWIGVSQA